jgi:hypothetical protein
MIENYQFERATKAMTGAVAVTALAAPPTGVSYRIFYVNGENDSGGVRTLTGQINSVASGVYPCMYMSAADTEAFITQEPATSLAEYPTIAVLDDSDETFELVLNGTGTMTCSIMYEIVDQTGQRTFRNAFATANADTFVELVPAPTAENVYRVINVNAFNNEAGTRRLVLNVGDGTPTEWVGELQALTATMFREHIAGAESPFPPIILSSTTDNLMIRSQAAGASFKVCAFYEVLDRRVV